MFKFEFQNYISQKECSLPWIIVAFSLLCAVLLVTSGSGIRRHNDTEFDHPKRWISDKSAIDRIPDDHTNKSINDQRSTTITDDHTSASIHDDQTNTSVIDDHTSASIHDDQTNTSVIDDHTSASIHDDQTNTSVIDDHTSASIHDDHTSTSFIVNHTSTCNPANHSYFNTTYTPTFFSTPLIPAHPRHPNFQPCSYPRTRCLHQQNVDEREIGFVQNRNRNKPLQPRATPVTKAIKSQEISNHPIRCLHLKNTDEREMAYMNMKNRRTFYQPRPTHATYDPSEVPLYMRNSVMVRPPPHKKDAPIRCLHMKYM